MHHGPKDAQKKAHADLSEQTATVEMWVDIARKTLVVALVSFTTWVGCSLMRLGVELGTEGLFHVADEQAENGFWLGAGMLVTVMVLVGILRGLLLLRPAWWDSAKETGSTRRWSGSTGRTTARAMIQRRAIPNRPFRTRSARSA